MRALNGFILLCRLNRSEFWLVRKQFKRWDEILPGRWTRHQTTVATSWTPAMENVMTSWDLGGAHYIKKHGQWTLSPGRHEVGPSSRLSRHPDKQELLIKEGRQKEYFLIVTWRFGRFDLFLSAELRRQWRIPAPPRTSGGCRSWWWVWPAAGTCWWSRPGPRTARHNSAPGLKLSFVMEHENVFKEWTFS